MIGKIFQNRSCDQSALWITQQMNTVWMSITWLKREQLWSIEIFPNIHNSHIAIKSFPISSIWCHIFSRLDHPANRSVLYTIVPGWCFKRRRRKQKFKIITKRMILQCNEITRLISCSINSILGAPVIIPCINTTYHEQGHAKKNKWTNDAKWINNNKIHAIRTGL